MRAPLTGTRAPRPAEPWVPPAPNPWLHAWPFELGEALMAPRFRRVGAGARPPQPIPAAPRLLRLALADAARALAGEEPRCEVEHRSATSRARFRHRRRGAH